MYQSQKDGVGEAPVASGCRVVVSLSRRFAYPAMRTLIVAAVCLLSGFMLSCAGTPVGGNGRDHSATPQTTLGPNLVLNGDFSQELDSWNLSDPGAVRQPLTGSGTEASSGRTLVFREAPRGLRLSQSGIALEKNTVYRLSVSGRYAGAQGLRVAATVTGGGDTPEGNDLANGAGDFYFSAQSSQQILDFATGNEVPANARLTLSIAAVAGEMTIEGIALNAVGPFKNDRAGRDPASWVPNPVAVFVPRSAIEGRGAPLPFTTYEAEDMNYDGTLVGPSRKHTDIAAEASGRQGIDLSRTGDFVEFKLKNPANSLLLRFAVPDANAGKGQQVPLDLYVNGNRLQDMTLSSEYAIVYGDFPWTNNPGDGNARHFFDETSVMFKEVPAGSVIRLQRPDANNAKYCIIDLADTELVAPPLAMPDGFVSIADFGAVPDDGKPDNAAIDKAIKAAKTGNKKGVWFPAGHFTLDEELYPDVVIRGAGMWYTELDTKDTAFRAINRRFEVHDLAIAGQTKYRDDSIPSAGFEGVMNSGSVIENVWIKHTKVGIWTDRGTVDLRVSDIRVRDTLADGMNLYRGTKNTIVENSHFRGTGDDAIAIWSATVASNTEPSSGNVIRNNTIQSPWLANGIAVYGGKDTTIENNIVYDTVLNGAGIDLSSAFDPVPFSGFLIVRDNTLIRAGSYNGDGGQAQSDKEKDFRGALWIDLAGKDMNAKLEVSGLRVYDATLNGITIEGPGALADAAFKDVAVDGAGAWGLRVLDSAKGTLSIGGSLVRNALSGGIRNRSDLKIDFSSDSKGF